LIGDPYGWGASLVDNITLELDAVGILTYYYITSIIEPDTAVVVWPETN
jgi:hypothetical protein